MSDTASAVLTPVTAADYLGAIAPPPPKQGTAEDVGVKAKELLGYTLLQKTQTKQARKTQSNNDLLAILREQEVPMYRPENVAAYKQQQIHTTWHKLCQRFRMIRIGLLASVLLLAATITGASVPGIPLSEILWDIGIPLMVFSSVVTGIWLIAEMFHLQDNVTVSWKQYAISDYTEEIPRPALELAVRLREASSEVSFFVQELTADVKKRKPLMDRLDPLMYIQHGDTKFCIAVWDEPGFNVPLVH